MEPRVLLSLKARENAATFFFFVLKQVAAVMLALVSPAPFIGTASISDDQCLSYLVAGPLKYLCEIL